MSKKIDELYYLYLQGRLTISDLEVLKRTNFINDKIYNKVYDMILDKQQRDFDILRGK